jgi:AcrR family transcriptional regulator
VPTKKPARRPARKPKARLPTQSRAHETVDALLAAAQRILVEDGIAALTTNAVAKRAGVSIGSLYQYFRGRDALLEELSRRYVDDGLTQLFAEVDALSGVSLELGVQRLVRLLIAIHRRAPDFVRAVESTRPELGARARLARAQDKISALAVAYLAPHREALVVDDLERAVFVVAGAIEALTYNAVLHRPDLLGDDRLADDLTRLVLGYLTGHAPPTRVPARSGRRAP